MADRKISDLTALTAPASGDFLPIVDISEAAAATKNKRITVEELMRGMPDGTAAAPGIAFENDPNTGIYRPGADQVAISTNGQGRLYIAADGKIGVNVSSPTQAQLVVASSAGANSAFFTDNTNSSIKFLHGGGGAIITTESGQYLGFGTNDTERLRITSAGLVGIGTSIPRGQLSIANNLAGTGVVDSTLHFGYSLADYYGFRIVNSSDPSTQAAGLLKFQHGTVSTWENALVINNSGNVGIGTTNPVGTLHVVGDTSALGEYSVLSVSDVSDATKAVRIAYDDVNDVGVIAASDQGVSWKSLVLQPVGGRVGIGATSPGELLELSATTDPKIQFTDVGNVISKIGISSSTALTFEHNGSERARIDSSGRVGIGLTSPGANLHINNNAALSSVPAIGSLGGLFNATVGSNAYGLVSGALNSGAYFFQSQTTDGTSATYSILLNPNGGNVGIGTTSPASPLHIATGTATTGRQRIQSGDGTNTNRFYVDIGFNTGLGAVNDFGISAIDTLNGANTGPALIFGTQGVFSGGPATERARIDSSGRLLVGTSSARTMSTIGAPALFEVESSTNASLSATRTANDAFASTLVLAKVRGAAIVSNNDEVGLLSFEGHDGTAHIRAAAITAQIDGIPGTNDMPGRLVFSTTADGAVSPTERLRIDSSGRLLVGTSGSVMSGGTVQQNGPLGIIANNSNSIVNNGTLDVTITPGGGSFTGFLIVENTVSANANERTQTLYAVMGRGTTATFTSLATTNGSGGAATFTVTTPSNGLIRLTNTSGQTTSANLCWYGPSGY